MTTVDKLTNRPKKKKKTNRYTNYEDFVSKEIALMLNTECSPPIDISPRLLHAILGIVDEAGELTSIAKKKIYYNKPIDLINLLEEFGDLWWFMRLGLVAIKELFMPVVMTEAEILDLVCTMNEAKLSSARYKNGYTDEAAITRDLAQEREVLEQTFDANS